MLRVFAVKEHFEASAICRRTHWNPVRILAIVFCPSVCRTFSGLLIERCEPVRPMVNAIFHAMDIFCCAVLELVPAWISKSGLGTWQILLSSDPACMTNR